jgi:hypothetical protein
LKVRTSGHSDFPALFFPGDPGAASFYFKGKQLPLPEIAKSLHVAYVLDGSVRKSGETLRVAARLVRADDGYVVWSELRSPGGRQAHGPGRHRRRSDQRAQTIYRVTPSA